LSGLVSINHPALPRPATAKATPPARARFLIEVDTRWTGGTVLRSDTTISGAAARSDGEWERADEIGALASATPGNDAEGLAGSKRGSVRACGGCRIRDAAKRLPKSPLTMSRLSLPRPREFARRQCRRH
jgi:hypothetical protein